MCVFTSLRDTTPLARRGYGMMCCVLIYGMHACFARWTFLQRCIPGKKRRACTSTRGVDTASCAVYLFTECVHDLPVGHFRSYASLDKCPAARAHIRAACIRQQVLCIDSRMLDNFATMYRWKMSRHACARTRGVDTIDSRNARVSCILDNFAVMHCWTNIPPRLRKHARRGYGIMCCVLFHGMCTHDLHVGQACSYASLEKYLAARAQATRGVDTASCAVY